MEQFANNVTTTLNGAINNSTTTVVVTSATDFPSSGNFRILVDNEIMKVTSRSGNSLTVERGVEGTTAASHANLADVTIILTADALNQLRQDAILDTSSNLIRTGTYASRPAANAYPYVIYLPTDRNVLYRSDGSVWKTFGTVFAFQSPVLADFSWVNQGTSTITDEGGYLTLAAPAGSGENYRLQAKAYTAPRKVTACFRAFMCDDNHNHLMLGFRNSSSGRLMFAAHVNGNKIQVWKANSPTSFNSTAATQTIFRHDPLLWMQVEDNATTLYFRFSNDGRNWYTIFSEARTAFVNTPDQFVWGCQTSSNDIPPIVQLLHWQEE